jgi:hypothetical protein
LLDNAEKRVELLVRDNEGRLTEQELDAEA